MDGKSKCKILKDIRAKIARENDIQYVTSECKFQGNCSGTCPKCEAELRYLEDELQKRRKAGKAVAIAGVAAALVVSTAGCDLPETKELGGDVAYAETTTEQTENQTFLDGEVPYEETTEESLPPTGETDMELSGDIAWPE